MTFDISMSSLFHDFMVFSHIKYIENLINYLYKKYFYKSFKLISYFPWMLI